MGEGQRRAEAGNRGAGVLLRGPGVDEQGVAVPNSAQHLVAEDARRRGGGSGDRVVGEREHWHAGLQATARVGPGRMPTVEEAYVAVAPVAEDPVGEGRPQGPFAVDHDPSWKG